MSPWRTLQWRRPARSSRARASASMSSDRSRPRPRSIDGPNSSSMRPVPVPRSSSERIGTRPARRRSPPPPPHRRHAACGCGPTRRRAGRNRLAPRPRAPRAPRPAARGRAASVASSGSSRAISSRASVARAAPLAQTEEGPRAFAEALDQPGFRQQPQMARDARLRLAQDVGEFGDRQLRLGQQGQDAQPRGLAGGLEGAVESRERQVGRRWAWRGHALDWTIRADIGEDIKISLYL